ncbi:exported hypothetical protein [Aeromicrobium sp. 9AM]|nr:exported hypothetical protein [Aeromicrobium sp. 9AM]
MLERANGMRLPPMTATRRTVWAPVAAAATLDTVSAALVAGDFAAGAFLAGAFLAGAFFAGAFLAGVVSAMAVSSIFVNDGGSERDERRIHRGGLALIHEVTVSGAFQIPMVSER